jgi:hypothetical protein
MAHPPVRAQALVTMLVPRTRRDSIVGDLLEEYRETQVPAQGVAAADRWYVRQALGFLWTAAWPVGVAVAGVLIGRLIMDVYVAPGTDVTARAAITTYVSMAIFTCCGFSLGRSTGRVGGAAAMALAATVVATIAAYAMTFAAIGVAAALRADARVWDTLVEGLDIPAHVIAVIGLLLATLGAAAGRAFPRWPFLAGS